MDINAYCNGYKYLESWMVHFLFSISGEIVQEVSYLKHSVRLELLHQSKFHHVPPDLSGFPFCPDCSNLWDRSKLPIQAILSSSWMIFSCRPRMVIVSEKLAWPQTVISIDKRSAAKNCVSTKQSRGLLKGG